MTLTTGDVYAPSAVGAKSKRKRKPKTHITVDHPKHGRIEIRHMTEDGGVAFLPPVDLAEGGT